MVFPLKKGWFLGSQPLIFQGVGVVWRGLKWFLDAMILISRVVFSLHAVPSHCFHQRQQQSGGVQEANWTMWKNWRRVLNILSPSCCLTTSLWNNWHKHLYICGFYLERRINLSYLSPKHEVKIHNWSDILKFWSTCYDLLKISQAVRQIKVKPKKTTRYPLEHLSHTLAPTSFGLGTSESYLYLGEYPFWYVPGVCWNVLGVKQPQKLGGGYLKNISQIGSFSQVEVKMKYNWKHQLEQKCQLLDHFG